MVRNQEAFGSGTLLKTTQSICPSCLQSIPAEVLQRDNEVWMDKTCPSCGPYSAVLSHDANAYLLAPKSSRGCAGSSCGCGDASGSHSCTLMVEITQKCNLTCPTCYAASSPAHDSFLSLSEYSDILDKLIAKGHSDADVLQLSGGEPTLHPELFEIIEHTFSKGFSKIYLNTNGVKLANPAFAEQLASCSSPVHIYLQFDGFAAQTYQALRGSSKLGSIKQASLQNCEIHKLEVTPVMTLTKGVNDSELAPFLEMAAASSVINKVMIQPAMYSGRYVNPRRLDRITASDTIELIAKASSVFEKEDFTPIPCGDPNCFRMALALRTSKGLYPVSRLFPDYDTWTNSEISAQIESVSDTFDQPNALANLLAWSLQTDALAALTENEVDALLDAVEEAEIGKGQNDWQGLFAIGIKPFMDAYTYDQDRIDGCCAHIASRDGTPVSFCQYNAINRAQGNL